MSQEQSTNSFDAFAEQFENDVVSFVRIVLDVGDDEFDAAGKQIRGIYPDQLELLEAYNRKDRRIAKRSGHGPGRSMSSSSKQTTCDPVAAWKQALSLSPIAPSPEATMISNP